jgi:hypothetical protein
MSERTKVAFTLEEIRAFKYLAIIQGIVACGIAVVAEAPLFAVGFTAAVMVLVPLLVYVMRQIRAKASDEKKPNKALEPTTMAVTPRAIASSVSRVCPASARGAPAMVVAHL